MQIPELTVRQRLAELLVGTFRSSRQLAELVGAPEREVEDHLGHLIKSLGQDRAKRFVMDPPVCQDCEFVFRERTRLTKPSRCPRCRSEAIMPPRFGIELRRTSRA
ncbi:MAG: transcriptional regulator [Nitrospiraceae bacterium]